MSIRVKTLRRYNHGVTMGITRAGLCVVGLNGRTKAIYSDKLIAERAVDAMLVRITKIQAKANAR